MSFPRGCAGGRREKYPQRLQRAWAAAGASLAACGVKCHLLHRHDADGVRGALSEGDPDVPDAPGLVSGGVVEVRGAGHVAEGPLALAGGGAGADGEGGDGGGRRERRDGARRDVAVRHLRDEAHWEGVVPRVERLGRPRGRLDGPRRRILVLAVEERRAADLLGPPGPGVKILLFASLPTADCVRGLGRVYGSNGAASANGADGERRYRTEQQQPRDQPLTGTRRRPWCKSPGTTPPTGTSPRRASSQERSR